MAGIRGNQAYLLSGIQTGKSVAISAWQDKHFFSGGNISPSKNLDQLAETDSSRDSGDSYVTLTSIDGNPEVYGRLETIHRALERVLGKRVTTGAGPYTHVLTAVDALPYVTYGRMLGGVLFEEFTDCKVSEATFSASTGGPLTVAQTVVGRGSKRLAAEWTAGLAPPAAPTSVPPNFNNATVKLGGVETRLVSSFETTVSNSASAQQTDDSVPFDVSEGQRDVSLGFDLIFETLTAYNEFHYQTGAGTTQGTELPTTSAEFTFTIGANSVKFFYPNIIFEEFPVEPDPGGDPIVVPVRAVSQRHAEGKLKATVVNGSAT
jgi:hypothetical protein